MKKIITTLALCLMAATAFSQSSESMTLEPQNYFRGTFEGFYAPSRYIYTGNNDTIDDEKFTSIGLGLMVNTSLSKTVPLYLHWGIDLVFNSYKWESEPIDMFGYQKTTKLEYIYFSFTYKANIGYYLQIPNTSVGFLPYAGLFARMHIGGSSYYTYPNLHTEDNTLYDDQVKTSLFTQSAENPNPWNRFELGANVGVKAFFGKFMIGVAYGRTFTDLTDDTQVSEFRLSAGLKF